MDWEDLLIYIVRTMCGLVITVGIPLLFTVIRKKVNDEKLNRLLTRVENIVSKAVILVDQTYVDALKEEGLFDKEAQKAAFDMCKDKVLAMLNEETIKALAETFADYEEWIRTLIEAYVRENKLQFIEVTEE